MTYTKKQFLEDVAKEAVALKKHATKEEIDRLNFDDFDPEDLDQCIYGQLGLNCRSQRSVELITQCCKRFFKNSIYNAFSLGEDIKEAVKGNVNGEKSEAPQELDYISSIEAYICSPDANNKNLIDFLKGNRKDLVL